MPEAAQDHQDEGLVPARGERATLIAASGGAFLAFLDATVVNVAFPDIRASFPGSSISDLSWVLNAYGAVFAAGLVVLGRWSDVVGRRRAFVAGTVLFTVASVACGLAPSLATLVAARVVQAVGAALLVPASLALVIAAAAPARRAHAVGLWGAAGALAAGLGPPVGGALVELGGWRWTFLVNLPLGVAAAVLGRRVLVESRAPGRRRFPDALGGLLLSAALGSLVLGIVRSTDTGWASPGVVAALVASPVLVVAFVVRSRHARVPVLDPTLLRLPAFRTANAATAAAGFGFYAYLLTNVLWLTSVWDWSVLRAGLALVPGAVVAVVVAARVGPLAARHGYRVVVVPGALVWAGAYLWYHQRTGTEPDFWGAWLPGQVLSGVGVGATLPVLGAAAVAAVPGGAYATASAVVSATRQIGGVLGVAVLVTVLGTPDATSVVGALRDGWLMSVAAFLAVAVLALPLGRVASADEGASEPDEPAVVHLPPPRGPRVVDLDRPAASALAAVPLFAALSPGDRRRLAVAAREVRLAGGEVLMAEGDAGDAVYVLRTGRLEVLVGGRVVRELGPGAVLGELAVLTGRARSATVRARRDSVLIAVTAADFTALLDGEPRAARVVTAQLAERLQDRLPAGEGPPARPTVVAVVGVHPGAPVAAVADALQERLARHRRVVVLRGGRPGALERAEREGALVLLVADAPAGPLARDAEAPAAGWHRSCVRQADQVVVVSEASATPAPVRPVPHRQPDVVLVGPTPAAALRHAWAAATDAWRVTVVAPDRLDLDLTGVADRLLGRSVGLVLGGGGARAFAHLGVLAELEDAGVRVDRLAGASMGAAVAGLYAQGRSAAEATAYLYDEMVRRSAFSDWSLPFVALTRGRRLEGVIRRGCDTPDQVFDGLPRGLAVVTTDLVSRTRVVHRTGPVLSAVRGSVGVPVLVPPVAVGGRLLVDGGVLDNLPVDVLMERDEGPVIAVQIGTDGGRTPVAGDGAPPPVRVPSLGETLMRTVTIGSAGAVDAARARGAFVVVPSSAGVGLLEFHQLDRMVRAGREAGRALLEATGGDLHADAPPEPVVPVVPVVPVQRTTPVRRRRRPVAGGEPAAEVARAVDPARAVERSRRRVP